MGLLRLLLAAIVLFEHTGGIGGYAMTGGALAVQCFFIISGFYMGLVLNERYDRPALNRAFYTNRLIRIFAMYYLFLALHLLVFALVEFQGGESPLASMPTTGSGWVSGSRWVRSISRPSVRNCRCGCGLRAAHWSGRAGSEAAAQGRSSIT